MEMDLDDEVVVLEMGMERFGEIKTLTNSARPDIAVITNIGDKGIIRVSSQELSKITGLTASQIRQDLNHFGAFGQQGSRAPTRCKASWKGEVLIDNVKINKFFPISYKKLKVIPHFYKSFAS